MPRGSCCQQATLEAPISSERVKPQRVKNPQTHINLSVCEGVCVYAIPDLLAAGHHSNQQSCEPCTYHCFLIDRHTVSVAKGAESGEE